ncbi:MAG: hypothetical protein ABI637_01770 [Gemmatimonadota bacterium]
MLVAAGRPLLRVLAVAQDSARVGFHQQIALDSTVKHPELDDPVIRIVQFIFQQPPWIMWGGAIVGGIVALTLIWWLWQRRRAIAEWLATRQLAVKFALGAVVLAAIVGMAGLGYRTDNFVMRDNRFCNGCHIFVASGEAPVLPDTGDYSLVNKLEGKHDSLSCHNCHTLHPLKEAVKMVYWMSGVRDKQIPPHARVPRDVCERCHVTGDAKKTWQAIAATAGHRTHLESDSSALKGKVECLTCHAQTAHRFIPANATCAQSGCHAASTVQIQLGKMASQTSTHCIVCHKFTAEVPALATRDSAASTLIPKSEQCFSCHQMKGRVAAFAPGQDPHKAACGMCHNPHTQEHPIAAAATCSSAACHADWKKNPFHSGAAHRRIASSPERCITCHLPHAARVDASGCEACHTAVREQSKSTLHPPLPFDTTRALQRTSVAPPAVSPPPSQPPQPPEHLPRSLGDGPPGDDPPVDDPPARSVPGAAAPVRAAALVIAAVPDSFSHPRHRKLPCLTCHTTTNKRTSLTFERPRGCQICHHQAPASSRCSNCHSPEEILSPLPASVTVTVAGHEPNVRKASFAHGAHTSRTCTECHTTAVTMRPAPAVAACQDCHDQHHAAGPSCATCHAGSDIRPAHARPVDGHRACDACHAPATVARLVPVRQLCLTCHQAQERHYPDRECTTCHFQRSPDEYRAHLTRARS